MSRLTHAELAAAQERGDWDLLWRQAIPLARLIVGRMARNSAVRDEDVEDLVQEGVLLAREAVESWRPIECALATWIGNRVQWGLTEAAAEARNQGIGSCKQQPAVLSLGDARDEGGAQKEQSRDDEDTGDDGSFDAALTYAGVVRRYTGQIDGQGYVPEGLGDPAEESERQRTEENVARAIAVLDSEEHTEILRAVYGFGRVLELPEEYAARKGISRRTAYYRLAEAHAAVAQILPNFRHK